MRSDATNRRLDVVGIDQFNQAPDTNSASELALGSLHGRLVRHTAEQHRVEVASEIYRDLDTSRPGPVSDEPVTPTIGSRHGFKNLDVA